MRSPPIAPILIPLLITAAGCMSGADMPEAGDILLRSVDCRGCTVAAESVAYLGHPDDTLMVPREALPAMDSNGRFYMHSSSGGEVLVFRPDGRLLTRFGKPGRGPGEFASLRTVVATTGDSLMVAGGGVIHVISPEFEHVRQFPDPRASGTDFEHTVLRDGRLLRLGSEPHSFSAVSLDGKIDSSITLQNVDTTYKCGECGRRVFRESSDGGTLWSGPFNQYVVEEHRLDGTFVRRIRREAEWFKAWGEEDTRGDDIDEMSVFRFIGASQDSDGILWTHTTGLENPDSLRKMLTGPEEIRDEEQLFNLMVTHIEAIDPDEGKLLGGIKLQGLVLPFPRGYSGQLVIDPSGDWAWKIMRLRVRRPE